MRFPSTVLPASPELESAWSGAMTLIILALILDWRGLLYTLDSCRCVEATAFSTRLHHCPMSPSSILRRRSFSIPIPLGNHSTALLLPLPRTTAFHSCNPAVQ